MSFSTELQPAETADARKLGSRSGSDRDYDGSSERSREGKSTSSSRLRASSTDRLLDKVVEHSVERIPGGGTREHSVEHVIERHTDEHEEHEVPHLPKIHTTGLEAPKILIGDVFISGVQNFFQTSREFEASIFLSNNESYRRVLHDRAHLLQRVVGLRDVHQQNLMYPYRFREGFANRSIACDQLFNNTLGNDIIQVRRRLPIVLMHLVD